MATAALTSAPERSMIRDPVVALPLAVAGGLAVGWLGVHEQVAGSRIAVDLALAWALVVAFVVVVDRPRRHRTGWALAAAAAALLAADLEWAGSSVLWTLGFVLEGLWVAIVAALVLTFPDGRAWSRKTRFAIAAGLAVTIGAQLAGVLVSPDTRNLLAVTPDEGVAHAIDRVQEVSGAVFGLVVLVVVSRRLGGLRGTARRSQGPLLVTAAVSGLIGLVWLGWVIATDSQATTFETIARAAAVSLPVAVVAGSLWSQLRRPQASDLVVELRTRGPATMRERLARALGDPTLDVAYRLDDGRYVDAAGRPAEFPDGGDRAVTPVTVGGKTVAALIHDPALLDEPALVESVRATAALVLENEHLAAEVRSQLAEVRASRGRIVAATDAERQRIERNLHDGAQQRLVTLSVSLGLEAARADPAAAPVLARAQDEVEQAMAELRDLARGIHPTLLRDEGLQVAVEALARRAPLPVTVHGQVRGRLGEPVELAGYFLVSEALTNVAKHASATEASVLLEQLPEKLRVTVADDGTGGAEITPGSGLAGLRDRLEAIDATLVVESRPGRGTTVVGEFPCVS
jgi:signal transduction histidine kinase